MAECSCRGDVRWLEPAQLRAWKALSMLLARLPVALEQQLHCDARLSYLEYYVLAGLSDQPTRSVRMSELAVLVNSELSRLSHLMRRLEDRGLVCREPDPDDGRYTRAVLTAAGLAHLATAAPDHVARVRELVFDVVTDGELQVLDDVARRVVARIDATARRGTGGCPHQEVEGEPGPR